MRSVVVFAMIFLGALIFPFGSRNLPLDNDVCNGVDIDYYTSASATSSMLNYAGMMPRMKGMTMNAWSANAYNSSDFDQSIEILADTKTNWVTFTIFWFMEHHDDNEIHPRLDLYTATDSSLVHAIQKAQALDMKIALKPMVDVVDGTWRGLISPANWTTWFSNYRSFINQYADFAEDNNVSLFVVGTELKSSQSKESEWRLVIDEVRTRFSQNITYSANWDSYGTSDVGFWDDLDYVGVDAYFPLTNLYVPALEQLISGWSYCTMNWFVGHNWTNELYLTHLETGKKIIFTEIGYCSQNGANIQPWNWEFSQTVDLQEQSDCYNAALEVFKNLAWFEGWFWWNWETDPNAGGSVDRHYSPQNKPAQNVLAQHYYEVLPDIAVNNISLQKDILAKGYDLTINVTSSNQGIYTETFNLTIYANGAAVQTATLTLENGSSTTISLIWNPVNLTNGNYNILAYAWPVGYEVNTENNSADSWVIVTIPGDVDGDFDVDILDVVKITAIYGFRLHDPSFHPNSDIDGDDMITILDVVICTSHYGQR